MPSPTWHQRIMSLPLLRKLRLSELETRASRRAADEIRAIEDDLRRLAAMEEVEAQDLIDLADEIKFTRELREAQDVIREAI